MSTQPYEPKKNYFCYFLFRVLVIATTFIEVGVPCFSVIIISKLIVVLEIPLHSVQLLSHVCYFSGVLRTDCPGFNQHKTSIPQIAIYLIDIQCMLLCLCVSIVLLTQQKWLLHLVNDRVWRSIEENSAIIEIVN